MSGALHRLTDRQCRTLPPRQTPYADGGNLYLVVDSADSRYWAFIWKQAGKRRQIGFGSLNSVSLSQAREEARLARAAVARGKDPRQERDARRGSAKTFGQVAEMVLTTLAPGWTNQTHAHQWRRSLTVDARALRDVPIDRVDTEAILGVLRPLWTSRPETASRLRLRLERTLDWARARGYRSNTENPARWRGHLRDLLPRRTDRRHHFKALPFEQLPELMQRLRGLEGFAPRALEFTILCATRTKETLQARWAEISFADREWTVPASRMKSRNEFVVPLSDQTMALLRDLPRMGEFVFPGRDPSQHLSHPAMLNVLHQLGVEATVHGTARAGFRTWVMEKTSFQREVAEMCLAHAVGDVTARSYARGDLIDKRRRVMESWSGFLSKATADVVPLRR
jgi:integrase